MRRGSRWPKATLFSCAWAAGRTKGYFRAQFHRIKARRGGKKAIGAAAASLLPTIYHMLKDGALYQDLGANHFDKRHKTASTRHLVQRRQNLGFAVQLTPEPPPNRSRCAGPVEQLLRVGHHAALTWISPLLQLHLNRQHDGESRLGRLRDDNRQKSGASASRSRPNRIRLAASGIAFLAAILPGSSQAQDPDLVRRRILCALLGGDLSEPGGIAAFQRCLANSPAPRPAPAPSPVFSSLILDHPAPLGPGVNRGNVDNSVEGQTFYF
jgi:hypothetical protein